MRPLMPGLKKNSEAALEKAREGLKLFAKDHSQLQQAVQLISALKNVGPATATLLLSVVFPTQVCFMSDAALETISGGVERAYNMKRCLQHNKDMRNFQRELLEAGEEMSLVDIERALWVWCRRG